MLDPSLRDDPKKLWSKAQELESHLGFWLNQAKVLEAKSDFFEAHYNKIVSSRSWRYTLPLRLLGVVARSLRWK